VSKETRFAATFHEFYFSYNLQSGVSQFGLVVYIAHKIPHASALRFVQCGQKTSKKEKSKSSNSVISSAIWLPFGSVITFKNPSLLGFFIRSIGDDAYTIANAAK
jgi:hypothetical protein